MTEQKELPRCPFCKAEATRNDDGNKSPESIVRCTECTAAAFISDWMRLAQPAEDERVKELIHDLDIAVNSCRDVTTLGRFAASVDPVGWVRELQAHLESVAKNARSLLPVQPAQLHIKASAICDDKDCPLHGDYPNTNVASPVCSKRTSIKPAQRKHEWISSHPGWESHHIASDPCKECGKPRNDYQTHTERHTGDCNGKS